MAMEFTGAGTGKRVELGTFDVPSGSDELSIFAWVIFYSFNIGDQRVISKALSHDIVDHWFMFSGLNSNQMRVRLKTGGTTLTHLETSAAINLNQLYHMGFVYNGSTVQFYRDGQQNGSSAQTGVLDQNGSVEVWIGDNPGINRKEFDGIVEDVRMYDRALSLGEVQTIYAARGGDDIVQGLSHRWLLNEGPAGQAATGAGVNKDMTGADHGTPTASPIYKASNLRFRRASARV
jgi:hypothetical protein